MVRLVCSLILVLSFVSTASAREIAGVSVEESVKTDDGIELQLNGAGIRSKLFFKVYIAQLYLENPSREAASIISSDGRKRMVMHFLYDEVGADKLVAAWNDGFAANLDDQVLNGLADRVSKFNSMFVTVKKGDEVILDLHPESGTTVTIKGEKKGTVEGRDFAEALLSIWLGKKPVTEDLREELLGGA